MNRYKHSSYLILFLSVSITIMCFFFSREWKSNQEMESELRYVKIMQNQTDEYLFENIELNRMPGLDLTQEYVRTLDDMIYKLGDVSKSFPKIYIYFSTNYCRSCVDYIMDKLHQINDSLGESCTTLLFHNYDSRQLYVQKVKNNLENDIYLVGDSSIFVEKLDGLSKPVILLANEKGLITSAYSPSADYDYLFNDYLNILKTNTFYKKFLRMCSDDTPN